MCIYIYTHISYLSIHVFRHMFLGLPRGINSIEVKTQPKTLWWIYRPCEHQISSNFLHASTFFKPPVTTTQTIRTTTKNSCTVKNPATFVTVVGFQKNSRLQDQPHRVPPSAMIGCLPILVTLDHRFLHVPWRDNNGCCIHPQSCIHRFNSKSYCISSASWPSLRRMNLSKSYHSMYQISYFSHHPSLTYHPHRHHQDACKSSIPHGIHSALSIRPDHEHSTISRRVEQNPYLSATGLKPSGPMS